MTRLPGLGLAERGLTLAERNLRRARNGLRLMADGRPDIGMSPKDVVWREGRTELWRYKGDPRPDRVPVLMVPSLLNRSTILDLRPGASMVETAVASGLDVFMVDWGEPDLRDADNDLSFYVDDHLAEAVRQTIEVSGAPEVLLFGYCLGGLLAVLTTAGHPDLPIRGLLALTTPVDVGAMGILMDFFTVKGLRPEDVIDQRGLVPAEWVAAAIKMIRPTGTILQRAELWQHLWNDEFLVGYRAIDTWATEAVPLAGAVFTDLVALAHSPEPAEGRFPVGDRTIDLADITCPVLSVVAEADTLVPTAANVPLLATIGSPDKEELRLSSGHIGVVVGRRAHKALLQMIEWLNERSTI